MEILFNRWRGTGNIYNFITGTMIYSLYLGLLFGLATQSIYVAILSLICFLISESFAFGKWVGFLVSKNGEIELNNKKGSTFPFIHQVANFFIKQDINYRAYCNLALFIRGLYWGAILYSPLAVFNYISLFDYILIFIIYGLGFPLACYLSTIKSFNYKNKFISVSGAWETQEVYYGFIHMICNMYILFKILG